MTLVVNFFAGPGVGKSTTAAELFAIMKRANRNVELAHEYAKDLTWEERYGTLKVAPYVFGKQYYRVQRLMDKVDVIITDSPILLQNIYRGIGWSETFDKYVVQQFKQWDTANIFLERDPDRWYNKAGRNQTEEESIAIDRQIEDMLVANAIPFKSYQVAGGRTARFIFDDLARTYNV